MNAPAPARIGRFAVLRSLGVGGMGVVYSAYDEELDRKVAIKLLHAEDLATQDARSRLLREAQAMARLSHPNVVQVYEVGTHQEQVYVAMELVEGVTLRAWLAEEPRSREEVLAKYIEAGRGLAAAHEAGIVHRDFKPENVLVGRDGRVRVLDFGLARPTRVLAAMAKLRAGVNLSELDTLPRDHAIPRSLLEQVTQPGEIVGTPAYMSPEQINGGTIDATTDQFSFSVALYEALYGDRPFQGSTWTELTNRIARGEIHTPAKGAKVPARIRQIVLRGLSNDPRQRYPSMNAMLDALADDPARRYRKAAVAALAVAAIAGPITAVFLREPPCRAAMTEVDSVWNAEKKSAIERAFAATHLPYAAEAFAIAGERLAQYAAAWSRVRVDACEATFIHHTQSDELFDLRMTCLTKRKRELEALIALLAGGGKEVVQHASDAVYGLDDLEPCSDVDHLKLTVKPPSDKRLAQTAEDVRRSLAQAASLERLTRPREGLPIAKQALASASAIAYEPVRAEALARVGSIEARVASSSVGVARLLEAVDLADEHRHDELAADVWARLTEIALIDFVDPERARSWNRRELAAARRLRSKARLADAIYHEGAIAYHESRYDDAERAQREALETTSSDKGPRVGDYFHSLAETLAASGKNDEAESAFAKALELTRGAYGPKHPRVADELLGVALFHMDRPERARAELAEALAIYTTTFGPDHHVTGRAYLAMANLDITERKLDSAEANAMRAAAIFERSLDRASPVLFEPANTLGVIAFMRRDYARALAEYTAAKEILNRTLDINDPKQGILLANIAEALVALGRPKDALAEAERAEKIFRAVLPENHELFGYALKVKGQALFGMGATEQAMPLLERAVSIDSSDEVDRADAKWSLARALARRDLSRARDLALESRAAYVSMGEVYRWRVAEIDAWLPRN